VSGKKFAEAELTVQAKQRLLARLEATLRLVESAVISARTTEEAGQLESIVADLEPKVTEVIKALLRSALDAVRREGAAVAERSAALAGLQLRIASARDKARTQLSKSAGARLAADIAQLEREAQDVASQLTEAAGRLEAATRNAQRAVDRAVSDTTTVEAYRQDRRRAQVRALLAELRTREQAGQLRWVAKDASDLTREGQVLQKRPLADTDVDAFAARLKALTTSAQDAATRVATKQEVRHKIRQVLERAGLVNAEDKLLTAGPGDVSLMHHLKGKGSGQVVAKMKTLVTNSKQSPREATAVELRFDMRGQRGARSTAFERDGACEQKLTRAIEELKALGIEVKTVMKAPTTPEGQAKPAFVPRTSRPKPKQKPKPMERAVRR
jgi:hypothetical protein